MTIPNRDIGRALPKIVAEMGKISIRGNIIPAKWFKTITFENGKPDTNSILILSDVVYWHRPTEIRCERSGAVIGYRKKFAEDMLRRSYADLEEQFGLSKKQCRDSLIRLENLGVMRRVLKNVNMAKGLRNNVLYLELIPSVVNELSNGNSTASDRSHETGPSNFDVTPSLHESYQGVPQNPVSTGIEATPSLHRSYQGVPQKSGGGDIEVTPSLHRSYHHIETNTSSNTTSNNSLSHSEKVVFDSVKDEREGLVFEKMIAIWNDLVPEHSQKLVNRFLAKQLEGALRDQLDGDLDSWKVVCSNFNTSKFLMGEAKGIRIKPDLSWLVDPKEPRVARVFSKSHWTFDDRVISSKATINLEEIEGDIASLNESDIAKAMRRFVLQSHAAFYRSYFKKASLQVSGKKLVIKASSDFSRDKIEEAFSSKLTDFLTQKHNMKLQITGVTQ